MTTEPRPEEVIDKTIAAPALGFDRRDAQFRKSLSLHFLVILEPKLSGFEKRKKSSKSLSPALMEALAGGQKALK